MTPEQFRAVLLLVGRFTDQSELGRDGFSGVSTFEVTFRSSRLVGIKGRSDEEAVQQVVDNIKALAKEFNEIGV